MVCRECGASILAVFDSRNNRILIDEETATDWEYIFTKVGKVEYDADRHKKHKCEVEE